MKTEEKEIAFKDNVISIENLPLPNVYYPGFYGAFFGFGEKNSANIYFCSCSYEAIVNYIKLRKLGPQFPNAEKTRSFILSASYFPQRVISNLIENQVSSDERVISQILFKDRICHECNKTIPAKKYCHPMYGGAFKENYGWYINKQAFEWGIAPISNQIIKDLCPQEILNIIQIDPNLLKTEYEKLATVDFKKAYELKKSIEKQTRKVWRIIENEVRLKFGHKKIGEAWTSETILYYIVKSLYPTYSILRHYRPDFLDGLELDIFIQEKNIGIEYQGIQHFKPIRHWGGKEAFVKLKARDKKKKEIMIQLNYPLVYFNYDEDLSDDLVQKKLEDFHI